MKRLTEEMKTTSLGTYIGSVVYTDYSTGSGVIVAVYPYETLHIGDVVTLCGKTTIVVNIKRRGQRVNSAEPDTLGLYHFTLRGLRSSDVDTDHGQPILRRIDE